MLKNRYTAVVILLFSIIFTSAAQSPYSMLGLGSLDDCTLGINSGMGSVGYAINNKMQINPKNPASSRTGAVPHCRCSAQQPHTDQG